MNQGAFLMRGLDKVRAEFSLTALVYNLRRALKPAIARNRVAKAARGAPGDVRDAIRGPDSKNPLKHARRIS